MISIVLIESENSANIGSIARAMANFGLKRMILVNPKVSHTNEKALCLAKHAKRILKNARIKEYPFFKNIKSEYDYVIGTTSVIGTDYNLKRLPLSPSQLAERLPKNKKTAIVFGRDGSGLRNNELLYCDFIVTIPSSTQYPALNISHSAIIIFYELYLRGGKDKVTDHIATATRREREVIMNKLNNIFNKLEFSTPEKKETQKLAWKNFVEKSLLTKREAFAIIGLLGKIEKIKNI